MSTSKNKLDAYARTLTNRIAELEAQLEAVVAGGMGSVQPPMRHIAGVSTDVLRRAALASQPAPAVVGPVQFKGGMTATDQSRELDAGFAAQNYCRSKWGAARGHAEWRRYHDAFVAGYLASPQPHQIAEPASRPVNCGTGFCSCIECLFEAEVATPKEPS